MNKPSKFLIAAPSYDENSGGAICLHKLCHLLNELGRTSYLTPAIQTFEISRINTIEPIRLTLKSALKRRRSYRTCPQFDTPVLDKPGRGARLDDYVIIYPEVVSGNPFGARNVVRWLLYPPGGITGKVSYGPGELYVSFNNSFGRLELPGSTTLADELRVTHYPLDIYAEPSQAVQRCGTAHLVRKGASKPLVHHPADSIKIDGLGHREAAEIFRSVQTFVSYDSYTAYSWFAALAGCDSVVIPDEAVNEDAWYPDPADRYGIAYGWDKLAAARRTRHLLRERLEAEQASSLASVRRFLDHVDRFFATPCS